MAHFCVICGDPVVFETAKRITLMSRGNRPGLAHPSCIAEMAESAREAVEKAQNKPVLKDIETVYTFASQNMNASAFAEMGRKGFGTKGKREFGKVVRVTSPVYLRLNSPVRYQVSIEKLVSKYNITPFNMRVKFTSPSCGISKVYTCRVKFTADNWQKFIRESEDDFCNLIGCGQWSALKTGTRKNK